MTSHHQAINLKAKSALIEGHWLPKVIAEMNNYQFKMAKIKGEFIWHSHQDTDETFIVIAGKIKIELRDGLVELYEGELFVVPKGTEHRPIAEDEATIMLIEPKGVTNTGDETPGEMTAENDKWI